MDEHLIETFYITRPLPQQHYQDHPEVPAPNFPSESSTQHSIDQAEPTPPPRPIRDVYFQRSYRMISKQVNCSAAVSVWRGKGSSVKKNSKQTGSRRFMEQFEDFFRTFIPPEQSNPQPLHKRKSPRSSHRLIKQKSERQSLESGGSSTDGEEIREVWERRQTSFYGKMKERIAERVEPLIDKSNQSKLRRVETRPKSKKTVAEVLKDKRNLKDCEPHLRLSRTGLVIRLDQMETKANQSNLRKIQTLKPKKDKIFQRCLIKNCKIVLENLQNYQQQRESKEQGETAKENRKSGKGTHKQHRRYNSSILNKTTTKATPTHASSYTQDLSLLKMREKCLDIQLTCKRSYKNNGGLKQGLKVFGKYCRKIQKKMQAGEERIDAVMAEEEQEEDAGRIYDCMSNIQPMQAYLSSLQ